MYIMTKYEKWMKTSPWIQGTLVFQNSRDPFIEPSNLKPGQKKKKNARHVTSTIQI